MKAILTLAALALFAVPAAAGQPVVFVDRTAGLGLDLKNGAACWADLDDDGWADLCAGGVVWRNNAGKGFARIADGLGRVVAADFDNDGFADLFSLSSKRMYRSDAGKAFTPMAMPDLPKGSCRGACWGDFNADGFADLYVGGYEHWKKGLTYPDVLLMNRKGKGFDLAWSDTRHRARGVTACDLDRDGDLDVYVSNYRLQPNVLWLNDGSATFRDVAGAQNAVATSGGFGGGHSIGAAWGDFDNDGDLDLATAGALFENQGTDHHWLKVRLRGDGATVNRSAIGTQVRIKLEDKTLTRQVEAGTGEGNQNALCLHFGLGTRVAPVDLEILWPGGDTTTLRAVEVDRVIEVIYGKDSLSTEA
ncbi:MAG: CRTAC1 family protein [Phycisphaerae bacterium]